MIVPHSKRTTPMMMHPLLAIPVVHPNSRVRLDRRRPVIAIASHTPNIVLVSTYRDRTCHDLSQRVIIRTHPCVAYPRHIPTWHSRTIPWLWVVCTWRNPWVIYEMVHSFLLMRRDQCNIPSHPSSWWMCCRRWNPVDFRSVVLPTHVDWYDDPCRYRDEWELRPWHYRIFLFRRLGSVGVIESMPRRMSQTVRHWVARHTNRMIAIVLLWATLLVSVP